MGVRVTVGVTVTDGATVTVGVRATVGVSVTDGVSVIDGVTVAVGVSVMDGVNVAVDVTVDIGGGDGVARVPVGVAEGSALASGDGEGYGSEVGVDDPSGVCVGVAVGTSSSTDPSWVARGTRWPVVLPKEAGGLFEKFTAARVVDTGWPVWSVTLTTLPLGKAVSGGMKS